MKKLLSIVAALALVLGLASCGSTGGSSKDSGGEAAAPKTYVLDIMDGLNGDTIEFVDNNPAWVDEGYTNRQNNNVRPNWTKFVAANKPKKGDTVRITGKITSDTTIEKVYFDLIDTGHSSGWLRLLVKKVQDEPFFSVEAGEEVEFNQEFTFIENVGSQLILTFSYGDKTGTPAKFKCARLEESSIE